MESTPSSPEQESLEILQLDSFTVPTTMSEKEQRDSSRRFLTLFRSTEQTALQGGSGKVSKVTNAAGETFALKEMITESRRTTDSDEVYARVVSGQQAAFEKEYENQQRLANLKGFPKLYGYGSLRGTPVILMEWIEGLTLSRVHSELAVDKLGRVAPLTIAEIALGVFELLARMEYLESDFIHRDLSPGNIMFRTEKRSIQEQCRTGSFDLCLIDFGSARTVLPQNTSFTVVTKIVRKATPEYAAPEMLSEDLPNVDELRQSPSIDVYAVCSILYELMAGQTPYRMGSKEISSYYRYKMENEIDPPQGVHAQTGYQINQAREELLGRAVEELKADEGANYDAQRMSDAVATVDRQLGAIIMKGLKNEQAERPSAQEMHDMVSTFKKNYFVNVYGKYHGEKLLPFLTGKETRRRVMRRPAAAAAPSQRTTLTPLSPGQSGQPRNIRLSETGPRIVREPLLSKKRITSTIAVCFATIVAIAVYVGVTIGDVPFYLLDGSSVSESAIPAAGVTALLAIPPLFSLIFFWAPSNPSGKFLGGVSALCLCDAALTLLSLLPVWQSTFPRFEFGVGMMMIAVVTFVGASLLCFAKKRNIRR